MKNTTAPALTVDNLMDTLVDERHLGFGFAGIRSFAFSRQMQAAEAVVKVANDLRWDAEALFIWSNSKDARFFTDAVSYPSDDLVTVAEQYVR